MIVQQLFNGGSIRIDQTENNFDLLMNCTAAELVARSLSDLGNRHEKWINLGQISMVLRRIVDLFNEKPGEYGQI